MHAIEARRAWKAAGAAFVCVGLLTWGLGLSAGRAGFVPRPLPRELCDLAVDCLAAGRVQPALTELSEAEFAGLVEIVARLLAAYGRGDFDSFLALRAGDLESAAERRVGELRVLRELGHELELPAELLSGDWIAALGGFWHAYYECPAVAGFVPGGTRVELHAEGLGARSLESWRHSFEAFRGHPSGPWIRHELCVPHRRGLEQVARDSGPLRWLDLELAFETQEGLGARLVTRFVWDGVLREWFLHEAASVYAGEDRSRRHLIL